MAAGLLPEHAAQRALEAFFSVGRNATGQVTEEPVVAGTPLHVVRLDHPGRSYFLIPIEARSGAIGVVQIDALDGEVEQIARVHPPAPRIHLSPGDALAAARRARPELRGWGVPFLGWHPCKESLDSIAPFWVVSHAAGRVYVDVHGRVHDNLSRGGRGG